MASRAAAARDSAAAIRNFADGFVPPTLILVFKKQLLPPHKIGLGTNPRGRGEPSSHGILLVNFGLCLVVAEERGRKIEFGGVVGGFYYELMLWFRIGQSHEMEDGYLGIFFFLFLFLLLFFSFSFPSFSLPPFLSPDFFFVSFWLSLCYFLLFSFLFFSFLEFISLSRFFFCHISNHSRIPKRIENHLSWRKKNFINRWIPLETGMIGVIPLPNWEFLGVSRSSLGEPLSVPWFVWFFI